MKKYLFVALLGLLLTGCGGHQYYYGPIKKLPYVSQKESATIVFITEESSLFGLRSPVYIPIIDGIEAYSLGLEQYAYFDVNPGEHLIKCSGLAGVATHPESSIQINPEVGETVYLYCAFETSPYRFAVRQLPEYYALEFMKDAARVGAR